MSTATVDAPARPRSSGGGGVLSQKLGPWPTWIWLLIATVGIAVYYLISKYRQSKTGTATSSTAGQAGVGQAAGVQDVPDIVLQNYTTQTGDTVNVPAPAGAAPPPAPAPAPAPAPTPTPAKPPAVTPPKPAPAQPPILNAAYTVKAGDTLNSLAGRFGISRVDLAHGNGLGTGAGLRTGQILHVPSPAPGGKPNPAK